MKCRRKSLIDWLYKNVLQCFDWLIVEPFSWEFTKTNREGERTIGCLRKLKMYRLIDCWTLSWRFVLIWGSIFSRLHPASREEGRGDYHHHHTHGASSSPETTDSGNIIERRHSRCARRFLQCCGSGSKLDLYAGTLSIRILIPNTDMGTDSHWWKGAKRVRLKTKIHNSEIQLTKKFSFTIIFWLL